MSVLSIDFTALFSVAEHTTRSDVVGVVLELQPSALGDKMVKG